MARSLNQDKAHGAEVAQADETISVNPGMKFEIQEGEKLRSGRFKLLEHAAEMQASGPNGDEAGSIRGSCRVALVSRAAGRRRLHLQANRGPSGCGRGWVCEGGLDGARQYWGRAGDHSCM